MNDLNRRAFLGVSARLAALMGLCGGAAPRVAEALEELARGGAPVLWLQGQCCSGCSISFLNSELPSALKVVTRDISLRFHQTLSSATGHLAVETVNRAIEAGGYVLIVEGSVPGQMPKACLFGEEPFGEQLQRAARRAKAVVSVGACAAFGGIPAARNNPTGAQSVPEYLKAHDWKGTSIAIPGCPVNPDWILGTLVHLLKFGPPPLDEQGRPKAFFSRNLHDQCPRFADYERERFARTYGEEGCLFKLGCLGPITRSDCNLRSFNGRVNSCIRAGSPCIGCCSEEFALKPEIPFTTKKRAARA
jgi:hydrogenase small subunit